ncbi:MAG: ATP-binding protein [Lysobacterales bacterium]
MKGLGKYGAMAVGLGFFLVFLLAVLATNIWFANTLVGDLAAAISLLPAADQETSLLAQKQFKLLQIAALIMAVVYFAGIIFALSRDIQRRDTEVEAAKAETDNILGTVTEGLFLLDKDLEIGMQQSGALRDMFGVKDDLNGNFLDFINRYVPESTLDIARDFIELLFGDRVKQKLIGDLNPLTEVEISIERRDGSFESRFLNFQFQRVLVEKKVSQLLTSVTDVTREVVLARQLEETKEQSEAQLDLLVSILHLDPAQVRRFLVNTEHSLDTVNGLLKEQTSGRSGITNKLAAIFRDAHKIKGEAAALEMHSFEILAHEFEDKVEELRRKSDTSTKDLLTLTVHLKGLYEHLASVQDMVQRFSSLSGSHEHTQSDENSEPANPLARLGNQVAERNGVEVRVSRVGLDDEEIPEPYRELVNDAAIQLVRNSVAHGIEGPAQRLRLGKRAEGQVVVSVNTSDDGELVLQVRDDGRGLNMEKIRSTAIEKKMITFEQANRLNHTQVLGLLFRPGFSTAEEGGRDAGRGVGLDVVGAGMREAKGRISVQHRQDQFCQFRLIFPAVADSGDVAESRWG